MRKDESGNEPNSNGTCTTGKLLIALTKIITQIIYLAILKPNKE